MDITDYFGMCCYEYSIRLTSERDEGERERGGRSGNMAESIQLSSSSSNAPAKRKKRT